MENEEYKSLESRITGILRTYLTVIIFLFGFFGTIIGWTAIEQIKTTKQLEQLKNDFGIYILMSPDDHKNNLFYNELLKKYFPNNAI